MPPRSTSKCCYLLFERYCSKRRGTPNRNIYCILSFGPDLRLYLSNLSSPGLPTLSGAETSLPSSLAVCDPKALPPRILDTSTHLKVSTFVLMYRIPQIWTVSEMLRNERVSNPLGWARGTSRRAPKARNVRRVNLVKLVPMTAPSRTARYIVQVGQLALEVDSQFDEMTLRRLVAVLRSC